MYGDKEIVKLLLDAGAEINFEDDSGCAPLVTALIFLLNGKDIIDLLIERGAKVNYLNKDKVSILDYASIYARDSKIIKLLIEKGANICRNSLCIGSLIMITAEDKVLQKNILKLLSYNNMLDAKSIVLVYKKILENPDLKNSELRGEIIENISEEISISNIFLLDEFTFGQQTLVIKSFLSLIRFHKLKDLEEIKNLRNSIIKLFVEYYKEREGNKKDCEKNFLNRKNKIESEILEICYSKKYSIS